MIIKMSQLGDDNYGIGLPEYKPEPYPSKEDYDLGLADKPEDLERQVTDQLINSPGTELETFAPGLMVEKHILDRILLLKDLGFNVSTSQGILNIFTLANTTEAYDSLSWLSTEEWAQLLKYINSKQARIAQNNSDAIALLHAFAVMDFPYDLADQRTKQLLSMLVAAGGESAQTAQQLLTLNETDAANMLDAVTREVHPELYEEQTSTRPKQQNVQISRPFKIVLYDAKDRPKNTVVYRELIVPEDLVMPYDKVIGKTDKPPTSESNMFPDISQEYMDMNKAENWYYKGPGTWDEPAEQKQAPKPSAPPQTTKQPEVKPVEQPPSDGLPSDEDIMNDLDMIENTLSMSDVLSDIGLGDTPKPSAPVQPSTQPKSPTQPKLDEPENTDSGRQEIIKSVKPMPSAVKEITGTQRKNQALTGFANDYEEIARKNRKPGDSGGIPADVAVYDWGETLPVLVYPKGRGDGDKPTARVKGGTMVVAYGDAMREAMVVGMTEDKKLAVRTFPDGVYEEWDIQKNEVRESSSQAKRTVSY